MKNSCLILVLMLCSLPVLSQRYNYDSLSLEVLEKQSTDFLMLPVYDRIDADFHYEEFDLTGYKVKNREGTFNIEVTICSQKVIFPKYHDLGGTRQHNSSLMLENGNILVVTGWIRTLVVGHERYNNIITTYDRGIKVSSVLLQNDVIVEAERSEFDLSKCR